MTTGKINLSEALRKLRDNRNSGVPYSVRKYRDENPNPYRAQTSSLARRLARV